ncbi:MAG: hypothetical protein ACXWL2_04930 [Candidatus Chromulinivorax sp.]
MYKTQKNSLLLLLICLPSLSIKTIEYPHLVVDNQLYSLKKEVAKIGPNPTSQDMDRLFQQNAAWLLVKITGLEQAKIATLNQDIDNNNQSKYTTSTIFNHMAKNHTDYSTKYMRRLILLNQSFPNNSFMPAVYAINQSQITSAFKEIKNTK